MPYFNFKNIKITGMASAVPTNIVTSESYNEVLGEDAVKKFVKMTGVKEVRKTHEKQTASDLGCAAAEKLLTEKNIDRNTIGAVIFAAHSTDYRRPATACVLLHRLGIKNKDCAAFDVSLGCSAFVYGVQIICSMMETSDMTRALLIVGETMSKMVYPEDKSSNMLFGDAGSAVLLEKTEEESTINALTCSDGSGWKAIVAPAGGFRNMEASHEPMIWADGNPRTLYNTIMDGMAVFNFTISDVPETMNQFFEKSGTTSEDYDIFALHQANKFILKQLSKKLGASKDQVPMCIDRFGNTSAAAIPLTICDALGNTEGGRNKIFMSGFGVGLSWGVVSAEIDAADVLPVFETDDYFADGIINSPEDM